VRRVDSTQLTAFVSLVLTQVGYGKEVLSRGRFAEVDTDTRGFTEEEAEVRVKACNVPLQVGVGLAGGAEVAVSPPRLAALAPLTAAAASPAGGSLSGGERQRLAAARLDLACRSPSPPAAALIVADEPTSACEAGFEERFFAFLAASEAATLVVAHRPELARHHTHELAFDGHGGAAMREL